ncbi:uncharacterized protein OCT59_024991 [Rhizophagus irregularis]|nr:hypothetical protein OCT59_024991 [Rhizophagus irregularis]
MRKMACFTGASLERRSTCNTGPTLKRYVEVQPTFRKKHSRKITQNKESKMSDKAEVPDKSKTSDKLEKFLAGGDIILNCFIPEPVEIDDEDEELEQCITEIKRRMGIIGSATGRNEAFEVVGEEASGRVDYAIKKVIDVVNEELIAITEGKQKDLVAGFMQNIMQLESSHHTNTRKRKASVAFDDEFDYLYGIVTTASDWYFLMYTPERIYCSKDDYHIALNEKIMKDDAELRRGVKKVMGVIVGLLKDRVEVDDSPDTNSVRPKTHIFLRVVKLEQDIDELKKELESKKNRKFQEKCILIAQVLLGEEPIVEYRPSFMRGLELDAFFRHHRMALEVQGAQHRLHNTSWYKDVKKLEDIVDRDRKKRTLCQLNGIYLLEVWYDENPEITIPQKIYKFKECIDRKDFNLD